MQVQKLITIGHQYTRGFDAWSSNKSAVARAARSRYKRGCGSTRCLRAL